MSTINHSAEPLNSDPLEVLTTREAAERLGVSLKSVQHWCESGLLDSWKTAGGHRRVLRSSIERLIASRLRSLGVSVETDLVVGGNARNPGELRVGDARSESLLAALTIYVVEDDPIYQKVYRSRLSAWQPQPRLLTFASGYEALVRIGQEVPDLLITDVRMPGMNGLEMLRALQRMPECAGMESLVVTGLAPDELDRLGGLPAGVRMMAKPPSFEQIEEVARVLLSTRGARLRA